jgi:hypothetical protein
LAFEEASTKWCQTTNLKPFKKSRIASSEAALDENQVTNSAKLTAGDNAEGVKHVLQLSIKLRNTLSR